VVEMMEIIGYVANAMLIGGWALARSKSKVWRVISSSLNLVGSIFMGLYGYTKLATPIITLNTIWAIISIHHIIKDLSTE